MENKKKIPVKKIIIIAIAIYCVAALIAALIDNYKLARADYVELDVQKFNDAYLEDKEAAKEEYDSKYYAIEGEVLDKSKNSGVRFIFESINPKVEDIYINMFFRYKKDYNSLKSGDKITAYCSVSKKGYPSYNYRNKAHYRFNNCILKVK